MERCLELAKQAVAAGLKGRPSCQRAASSLGSAASSNSHLPPIPHMPVSIGPTQTKAGSGVKTLQGGVAGHALPAMSPADGACLNNQLADAAPLPASCSTAAVGGASPTAADSSREVPETSGCNTAALDAEAAFPRALSSNLSTAPQTNLLSAMPSSRHLLLASPDAEADANMPSSSIALPDDGTAAGEEEQAQKRHLESPGRFGAAQFLLMQQRQQRLQENRLAALKEAGEAGHMSAAALLQQSQHQQTSGLLASLQPVLPQISDTIFEPAAKRAHRGAVWAEAVASSPVVLFSPGGPYCDKSKWCLSAGMMQVRRHDNKQQSCSDCCHHETMCRLGSCAYSRNQSSPG